MSLQRANSRSVVITGAGVVSPVANSASECVRSVCQGDTLPPAPADANTSATAALDIALDVIPIEVRPRIGRMDRLCKLFLTASYRAIADARLDIAQSDGEHVGLSFGTGLGCLLTNAEFYERIVTHGPSAAGPRSFAYTVSSAAAGEVSIALGIKGPNLTSHSGLAAGAQAIGYAADLIRAAKAEVMLAGGADALGAEVLRGLTDMRLLRGRGGRPFDDEEPGINPSEAAAVLVLEEAQHARSRGARVLAQLTGYGLGCEPTLTRRQPSPLGIEASCTRALEMAGAAPDRVDVVVTSAQATRLDAIELSALRRVLGTGRPLLLAPKRRWGECFAASGALAVTLAAELVGRDTELRGGVGYDLHGSLLPESRALHASLALVHTLCYAGPTVALLLGASR